MRERLIAISECHPINLDIIVELGAFPNRKAAAAWASRQESSGTLTFVGTMKGRNGRKSQKVYCGWKPKEDALRHEIIGTRVHLLYPGFSCERGYNINDCLPDLLLTDGEHTFEVEVDCGTLKSQQIKARAKRHKCDHDILMIAAPQYGDPERRMQKLMQWSEDLDDRWFFTTLDRLQTHGSHSYVWDFLRRGDGALKRVKLPVASTYEGHIKDTVETTTAVAVSSRGTDGN